jgi:PadR family transcriptional regulator AphA
VTARSLLPAEYAVLGLLAIRPMHGYEMARYFDRDDLTEVCPVEQSLLYTYLRNVEERGLVAAREIRVGRRPPRRIFHLTGPGRAALDEWLKRPVDRIREVRLDFLLKLYMLRELDPAAERDLVRRQLEVCETYRERLEGRAATASGFEALVVGSKLSAARATVDWLRDQVAAGQPPVRAGW